jgi:hypothetical protein
MKKLFLLITFLALIFGFTSPAWANIATATQGLDAWQSIGSSTFSADSSGATSRLIDISNGVTPGAVTNNTSFEHDSEVPILLSAVSISDPGSSTILGSITDVYSDGLLRSLNINTTLTNIHITLTPGSGSTMLRLRWADSSAWTSIADGNATITYSTTMLSAISSRVLEIEVAASDSNLYLVKITVINDAVVNLATNVTIRTGESNTSPAVVSFTADITSISGSITMVMPTSYSTTTTFYAHIALYSGVALNSATFGGSNANIAGGNIVTLSFPAFTNSQDLVLNFSAAGVEYNKTITVTRAASASTLSNLSISSTNNKNSSNLFRTSPAAFASSTRDYIVYVDSDTEYIYIYPTKANSSDTVSVSGAIRSVDSSNWNNSGSGSGYFEVRLYMNGTNMVYIGLNDNSDNRYTLTIEREAAVMRMASLNSLSVRESSSAASNYYELTPAFSYNKLNYEVDVPLDTNEVFIHAIPYSSAAVLIVSGATAVNGSFGVFRATLIAGQSNIITIMVRYGSYFTYYTININCGDTYQTTYAQSFPDQNFRRAVLALLNVDGGNRTDGSIITAGDTVVLAKIEYLNVSNMNIRDLAGLDFFAGLKRLLCFSNTLASLDISRNTALEYVICFSNQLSKFDVSKNTSLQNLDCSRNQLSELDVSNNAALESLNCSNNQLAVLDVSYNAVLLDLLCNQNNLFVLDISKNAALEYFNCGNNKLSTLDVTKNTSLLQLSCGVNQLKTLDLSKNTTLKHLDCTKNYLPSTDAVIGWQKLGLVLDYNFIFHPQKTGVSFPGAILYQPSPTPATISPYNNEDPPPIATATTTDDGAYTLAVPTPQEGARYKLVITKPGYLSYTIKNLNLAEVAEIETIDIRQLAGDVNGDGIVNAVDLTCLLSEFNREPHNFREADIDGNGIVNAADLTYLLAGFNKRDVVVDRI